MCVHKEQGCPALTPLSRRLPAYAYVEVRIGQSDLVTKDTMTGWLVSVQHTGLFGIVTGLGKARAKSLTPEQRRRIARAAAKARWKK